VYNAVLEGPEISSARALAISAAEEGGDGTLDAGESGFITLDVLNVLAVADPVQVNISTDAPGVTIDPSTLDLGRMQSGELRSIPSGTVRITVPAGLSSDTRIVLRFAVTTVDRTDVRYHELVLGPTWMTTDLNEIAASFNSAGGLAHNASYEREGDGFRFKGGDDVMFHGGLMVGVSATRLASAVRSGLIAQGSDSGFQIRSPYRLTTAPDSTFQVGSAAFDDSHLEPAARVGIDVALRTYERTAADARNLVLAVYRIRNTSATELTNAFAALYLDWDLSDDGEGDAGTWDEADQYGSVANSTVPELTVGAALASDQPMNFDVFDNYDVGLPSSFPPSEKFTRMSSGILTRTVPEGELGMIIGAGPFTLAAGAATDVAFVLAAGQSADDLRASIARGRELFRSSAVADGATGVGPGEVSVSPNPAGEDAAIAFWLKTTSSVVVRLLDVHGREVSRLFTGRLGPGRHSMDAAASTLADGLYFVEVSAAGGVARGTLVKLRH
jgi:hypothetical protein